VGEGPGEGFTLNVPLPAGSGNDDYLRAFDVQIAAAVRAFAPDFILISAGFDAHRDDPLAGMRVTEEGYAAMTRLVTSWAADSCEGRIVSCLEGGYDLDALGRSVEAHVAELVRTGARRNGHRRDSALSTVEEAS
jgi:acetoin utilization deacetylase AcuC-like enzyme